MRLAVREWGYWQDIVIFHKFIESHKDVYALCENISGGLSKCDYNEIRFINYNEMIGILKEQLDNSKISENDMQIVIDKIKPIKDAGYIY